MKARIFISIVLTLAIIMALSGCGMSSAVDLMANVQAAEKPANPTEPDHAFIDSVGEFSWSLFRDVIRDNGNPLVSPVSVYLALAMTMNGAGGTTRDAMLQTLSAKNLSVDKVNIACRDWMILLMNTGEKTDLMIGNSIWYNKGFTVDPAFLKTNADYFTAALRQMNFADSKAVEAINNWVQQATNGKIDSIMDKTHESDLMYLINAVYFKSQWLNQFADLKTYQDDFNLENGTTTVSYMNRKSETFFLANDGLQGVLLPFVDTRFAFTAIMPAKGSNIRDAVSSMDQLTFKKFLDSSQKIALDLHVPKFEIEFEISLLDSLASMGMGEAFQGADFSLMDKNRGKDLVITDVNHKTYFKIDENGVEAAAITGLTIAGSAEINDVNKLVFDRPFLYGIIDTVTGLPLFLGIMDNPAQ